jgi:hypothetical protein
MFPQKKIEVVIRPNIIEMDAKGCETIINKLNEERRTNDLIKEWKKSNREKIRSQMSTR